MRYGVKHKEETRERIVQAAAKRVRAEGTEAIRVADLMQAAGLTHGGFYKHFKGKDQLLEEAVQTALLEVSAQIRQLTEGMPRQLALQTVIEFYLSEQHMQHPDLGCALAALGTEMARLPRPMKVHVSKALDAYAERMNYLMPGETESQRRSAFLVLFPSMAGCIMTARAYASKERKLELLAGSRAFFTQAFCGNSTYAPLETSQ